MVFESAGLTKMERIACRSGKIVPIRTQLSDRLAATRISGMEETTTNMPPKKLICLLGFWFQSRVIWRRYKGSAALSLKLQDQYCVLKNAHACKREFDGITIPCTGIPIGSGYAVGLLRAMSFAQNQPCGWRPLTARNFTRCCFCDMHPISFI